MQKYSEIWDTRDIANLVSVLDHFLGVLDQDRRLTGTLRRYASRIGVGIGTGHDLVQIGIVEYEQQVLRALFAPIAGARVA